MADNVFTPDAWRRLAEGAIDKTTDQSDDQNMTAVTKDLLDARLETIETRMDGRLASIEAKMDTKFAELRTDMHKNTSDLVKWVVGSAIAMGAVGITIMAFVLNNAVPKAPPPPAPATPAPIVIYAQPAPMAAKDESAPRSQQHAAPADASTKH